MLKFIYALFQVFDFAISKEDMVEIANIKETRRYFDMMGIMYVTVSYPFTNHVTYV